MSKTVAIHQPNWIPYLGYFDKIRNSDIFVFLDNVTYTKNDFINRNKIKTPDGWCWLTVPVVNKNILKTPICEVKINNSTNWRKKHWNSIKFNYGRAPHFEEHRDFFEKTYHSDWRLLAELNKFLIKKVCTFLGIKGIFVDASTLDVKGSRTTLLVDICEALEADTYLSGIAGKNYIRHDLFEQKNIDITFQEFKSPTYPQLHGDFIPNLSIIDYLLNCGGENLNDFETR